MHELDADDDYSSSGDPEDRSIGPAVFNDTVGVLAPAEPVCLRETATVTEAAHGMLQARQAAVLVVDAGGRLAGIFTERDLLTRVIGRGVDPEGTPLAFSSSTSSAPVLRDVAFSSSTVSAFLFFERSGAVLKRGSSSRGSVPRASQSRRNICWPEAAMLM